MLNSNEIQILKKVAFVADVLQRYGEVDTSKTQLKINSLIPRGEELGYALKVLNFEYETYTPERTASLDGLSVTFNYEIDFRLIYYLVYLLKELYGDDEVNIFLTYTSLSQTIKFGSYISSKETYTNISRVIKPSEIVCLNIERLRQTKFLRLFPNLNYNEHKSCFKIKKPQNNFIGELDELDYQDYGTTYQKYGGYNGFSDDEIDDAFEEDPLNTWNVD